MIDPAQTEWMVRSPDGSEVGPVSFELLRRGHASGKLPKYATVAPKGSTLWRPIAAAVAEPKPKTRRPLPVPRYKLQIPQPVISVAESAFDHAKTGIYIPAAPLSHASMMAIMDDSVVIPKESYKPALAAIGALSALTVLATFAWLLVSNLI